MKLFYRACQALLIVSLVACLSGCGSSSTATNPEFKREARRTVIRSTAVSYATKYALYWESVSINNHLERVTRNLDNTFNFRGLLLKNEVLPPILRESSGNVSMESPLNIRTSDRMLEIIQPARFSSAIPTWRNYLHMSFTKPELPQDRMLPQSTDERKVWDEGLIEGWNIGRWQARSIFASNIGLMQRDLLGMILYHKLLSQGMISPTYSATANLGVTGNGKTMHLNDRVVKITSESVLTPERIDHWKPAILPS